MSKAFDNFGKEVGSVSVQRAITLIMEAQEAGGQISNILDSVANSIYQIEKLNLYQQFYAWPESLNYAPPRNVSEAPH